MLRTPQFFTYRRLTSLLISLAVLLVSSCGNDTPVQPNSSDDGRLTLNLMLAPSESKQQGKESTDIEIVLAEVEVIGAGIKKTVSETVSLTDHQGKVTLKVPEGNNRVIRITGKDRAGITQAVIKGYVNVTGGETRSTTVDWRTTPVGEVIEKLIHKDYEGIEGYDAKELQIKVDSVFKANSTQPIAFDIDKIADHIIENGANPTDVKSFVIHTIPPPSSVVIDDGDCTTDGSQLHASWTLSDNQSKVVEYQYAVGTSLDGTDVVDWTSVDTDTSVTKTGLSLTPGQTYYFSVKAINEAGLSSVSNSDGIMYQLPQIGVTPVSLTFNAVAGGANPDTKKLRITNLGCGTLNWNITDDAGWLSCTPIVGDSTTETDEVTVSANISGLSNGIHNAAITVSATVASNTPQTVPVELNITGTFSITLISPDGGEQIGGRSTYSIAWKTVGSGVHHIRLLYSTDGGRAYPHTIIGSTADDGIHRWDPVPLLDTSIVRVKVVAEDSGNAELAEDISDDNFTIDSTAPETIASLSGRQGTNGWYTSDVEVRLSAVDVLSDIRETWYNMNAGTWTPYGSSFTIITDTRIHYYSIDSAGITEIPPKLTEVKIDKTPPDIPVVTDDGDVTDDSSMVHASWTSTDAESGVVEYQYAIGTSLSGTDMVNWTSVGISTSVTKTGLSLTPGRTYYFSVKAINEAGLSSTGNSDGITYQLPEISVTPTKLNFDAVAGRANPDTKKLTIANLGFGTLNWNITDDAGWLFYTPTVGDSTTETDEVTVSTNISGLSNGIHSAAITVSATIASNTPQTVQVELSIAEAPSITLISPNGGEKIRGEDGHDIAWKTTGSSIHHIRLLYSTDGGGTYRNTVIANTANDGIHEWRPIPSLDLSTVRIKVIAEDGSNRELVSDTSNGDFIIDSSAPDAPFVRDEGGESRDATLIFSWDRVSDISGIEGYELQISTTPDFTQVIVTKSVPGDVAEVVVTSDDGIGAGITYYARVRVQDGVMLWSEWSEPTDGITVNPPKTSIFVVDGEVIKSGKPAPDGLTVIVNIIRGRNVVATKETTTGRYGEPGRYTVTVLDFANNRAANVGDVVELIVKDTSGREIGRKTHVVSEEDIENKKTTLDVAVN